MTAPSQSEARADPTPADVLRWVAASGPHLWFPSRHAFQTGLPRNALDEPLWVLRQAGLVQVGDWVKDVGQGFRLTPDGERAVGRPNPVPVIPPRNQQPPDPIPPDTDDPLHRSPYSTYATGETARRSLLDPAPAVITPVLLVVNIIWFLFGGAIALQYRAVSDYLKGSNHPLVSHILYRVGAASGSLLLDGEWWRLLTCTFVHIGLFHLLCNMITLGLLGPVAEGVWGRWRFTLIYLLAGLAGSATALALRPQTDVAGDPRDLLLGGASGCLWGLTTAVIAWLIKNMQHLPTRVGPDWTRKLLVIGVMNVVISFAPGVSLEAHLGGGVSGVLVALCLARIRGDRRESLAALAGLVVVVAVFAGGLMVAMNRSDDWQQVKQRWAERQEQEPPADAAAGRP